jgi:predicted 3-demethylubiquinone-9 3-methyltransferase (glyoxalase superfamily)
VQKIVTNLWFDTQAEEAANFYCSLFPDSKVLNIARYGSAGPGPEGQVMVVDFQLAGQRFTGINGGPEFNFSEAISLLINCESQEEVDRYWDALLADGGEPSQCGWLKDKYGLSWQVVPREMDEMIASTDAAAAQRAMAAMLKMVKLDLGELKRAYAGE